MNAWIIRPGALGDTLMLLPSLVASGRGKEIMVVGRQPGLDFIRPHVRRCLNYETHGWHRLYLDDPDDRFFLSLPPPDLVTAFLTDPEGKVRRNLGVLFPGTPVRVYPPFPPQESDVHVACYIARGLEQAGLPVDSGRVLEAAASRPLLKTDVPPGEGHVVFHPGSGSAKKNLPPDLWLELIADTKKVLFPNLGKFVVLLGPAEEPLQGYYEVGTKDDRTEVILSPAREVLMALLARAALYLGHDSGITHLAAMIGTPVVALFRIGSVRQWRPLGPSVKVLAEDSCGSIVRERIVREAEELIRCL